MGSNAMRGSVVLVIAALAAAGVGSVLLWVAPRLFRRRPPSLREQLAAISPQAGDPVGPADGISAPRPLPDGTSSGLPGSAVGGRDQADRAGPAGESPAQRRGEG